MTLLILIAVGVATLLVLAATATQNLTFGHAGAGISLNDSVTLTGTIVAAIDTSVAAGAVNTLSAIGYITANIKSMYIKSDQDVTIKVDSTGSPEQTVVIKAGVPYVWCTNVPWTNLFATDCNVGWYLSNAGATAANFYARILN